MKYHKKDKPERKAEVRCCLYPDDPEAHVTLEGDEAEVLTAMVALVCGLCQRLGTEDFEGVGAALGGSAREFWESRVRGVTILRPAEWVEDL